MLILDVLQAAAELLSLPDNDFTWSSWKDQNAATQEINGIIAAINRDEVPERLEVAVLFAATGPIQEVSLSSGWDRTFLKLAELFDCADGKLW